MGRARDAKELSWLDPRLPEHWRRPETYSDNSAHPCTGALTAHMDAGWPMSQCTHSDSPMMVAAVSLGLGSPRACDLAALLSERDICA